MKKFFNEFCFFLISVVAPLLFLSSPALAGTASATFTVSASIPVASCTISATNLPFGTYNPGSTSPLNYANSVVINCNGSYNVAVYPGSGLYSSFASGTTRAMSNGSGSYLSYDIFKDPNHTTVWNSTNPDTYTVYPNTNYTSYGYGQIPIGQYKTASNYTDTVSAIVNF